MPGLEQAAGSFTLNKRDNIKKLRIYLVISSQIGLEHQLFLKITVEKEHFG